MAVVEVDREARQAGVRGAALAATPAGVKAGPAATQAVVRANPVETARVAVVPVADRVATTSRAVAVVAVSAGAVRDRGATADSVMRFRFERRL